MSTSNNMTTLKLLLMGDSGTGKSSILLRFCDDQFLGEDVQAATIGVDFKIKLLDKFWQGKSVKLTIWDTAGQERFRSLTSSYYRGAQGVILVYDVTSRESFDNLKATWLKELQVYSDLDDLILMVVGNKVDLEGQRKVSTEEGSALAQELSALFMESSAKIKIGIKAIFEELVRKILITRPVSQSIQERKENMQTVRLEDEEEDLKNAASSCNC